MVFIYSFSKQIFIEPLLGDKYYSRSWENRLNKHVTLMKFTGINGRRKTINKQISTMTGGDKCRGGK